MVQFTRPERRAIPDIGDCGNTCCLNGDTSGEKMHRRNVEGKNHVDQFFAYGIFFKQSL
jgi:hypothetical protein